MKVSEFIAIQEESRRVVIEALLTEIRDLEKELSELKKGKELIIYEPVIGFDIGNSETIDDSIYGKEEK